MTMLELTSDDVRNWKCQKFTNEIPLGEAVQALRNPTPNNPYGLEARVINGKAFLYSTRNDAIAVFCHVALFSWSSPLDTGNFLPTGEPLPIGLPFERVKRTPSMQCEISVGFDTREDESLYDMLELESLATQLQGFNPGLRPRTSWQDGSDRRRFVMTCPIFSSTRFAARADAPYTIHPWIADAVSGQSQFFPFPERTQYLQYEEGELKNVTEFQRDDVLWISFVISYHVGAKSWGAEVRPLEIINLGRLAGPTNTTVSIPRPRLQAGRVDLVMADVNNLAGSSQGQRHGSVRGEQPGDNEELSEPGTLSDSGHSEYSVRVQAEAGPSGKRSRNPDKQESHKENVDEFGDDLDDLVDFVDDLPHIKKSKTDGNVVDEDEPDVKKTKGLRKSPKGKGKAKA